MNSSKKKKNKQSQKEEDKNEESTKWSNFPQFLTKKKIDNLINYYSYHFLFYKKTSKQYKNMKLKNFKMNLTTKQKYVKLYFQFLNFKFKFNFFFFNNINTTVQRKQKKIEPETIIINKIHFYFVNH